MKPAAAILPVVLAASLCGCLATQQRIDDLSDQINALNSSLSVMQKNQLELNAKMDALSKNLTAHSENLKDFNDQLSRLSAKMDDIEANMGTRMKAINKTIERKQEETDEEALPSKTYSESYALLMKKNYDRAAQGFQLYIEKFPSGELADSAYYYLGDAYSGTGRWDDAAIAYATMLDKYKTSQYTAAARLKYALTILKLPGPHIDEAARYFKSVISDYPGTEHAKLAKDYLNELNRKVQSKKQPAKQPAKK